MAVPIVAGFVVAALPAHAASIPSPAVTGPVAAPDLPGAPTHNYPFFASNHELAAHGYVEQEFFYSGTANRYNTPTEATGSLIDGNHSYATRMIVRRPADPKQFNGTVLVEWLNVTNGFDADNAWFFSWEHILGAGYAWVGVSAQQIGVNALKTWSPSRYGTLDVTQGGAITDDSLSYDIFTQAGQAIRHPTGVDPLGGLKRQTILAIGESQSAGRLATYVNSINPLTPEYDGFFLLSTGGTLIRPDLKAPVFKFLTEYDVENSEATTRQPDTSKFHTWEVAGASHVDKHLRASRQPLELRDFSTSTTASSSEAILQPQCAVPSIGTSVPTHYVVSEAYDLLVRWATKGTPPPSAPRIQITSFGATGQPSVVARNSLGLALGGIQLAELSVPTAKNVGVSSGPGACVRWGYSTPFSLDLLNQLYPNHDRYVDKVIDATRSNVRNQYISAANGRRTVVDALISDVGGADQGRDNDQDFIDWSRDPDFK
ncbi:MAG TPA: alpha/beta hydrolase domain-containing protein [Aliidongia sp.]|nr:alpha/beta hydrolase domain-containing protein [Aliidongia sp.]